jgi:transcriptional regulator with XRE-family HTH domain
MSTSARFGQSLREARERRGLTIEQLSQETTIPVVHIEALETGLVDALPRAMYRRAEARAYAEAVGLDPDVVLTELRRASDGHSASREPRDLPRTIETAEVAARQPRAPVAAAETEDAGPRIARAIVLLVIGCAGLMWEQGTTPAIDIPLAPATAVPALDPASLIGEAVRIAEPPPAPPSMRRVLFEPGASARQRPGDGRMDEGMLVIRSTPPGARVTVNGVGWGETPVAVRYLPMGTMRVRVGNTSYGVQERVVQLTPDQPTRTLRFTLRQQRQRAASSAQPRGDMLVITSIPAGARVTVNGIGWGTTPLSIRHLPAGAQRVRLVKERFKSEERVVYVGEERPGRLSVTLKPRS